MNEYWIVLKGHESGCPCFGCCFLNMSITREAAASIALDRDSEVQTISIISDDAYSTSGEDDAQRDPALLRLRPPA